MSKKENMLDSADGTIDRAFYNDVRSVLENARKRTFAAINSAMVEAYWNVGRIIVERQGGAERADYGDGLIKSLSRLLTAEYGKGFDERNLWFMRKFYLTIPNVNALRSELFWTYCRLLMRSGLSNTTEVTT